MSWADILGIAGVFILLLAYFLQLAGTLKAANKVYLLLNISGALLAAASSYLIGFVPFIVLELTWAGVSMITLVRGK